MDVSASPTSILPTTNTSSIFDPILVYSLDTIPTTMDTYAIIYLLQGCMFLAMFCLMKAYIPFPIFPLIPLHYLLNWIFSLGPLNQSFRFHQGYLLQVQFKTISQPNYLLLVLSPSHNLVLGTILVQLIKKSLCVQYHSSPYYVSSPVQLTIQFTSTQY